jgi:hypothetical protein
MTSIELLEAPRQSEALIIPENLDRRISDAVESCEFQATPEVTEALSGYYTDHYALAGVIEKVCDGTLTDGESQAILSVEDGTLSSDKFESILRFGADIPSAESAVRLLAYISQKETIADPKDKQQVHESLLRSAGGMLRSVLFQEESLGITTIGESELSVVDMLYDKLLGSLDGTSAEVTADGRIRWDGGSEVPNPESIKESIAKKKENFWSDCRQAGQLEFHNTGFLGGVSSDGGIMSRTEQFRRSGEMRYQTNADLYMHSNVPHFSEVFSPSGYKSGSGPGNGTRQPLLEQDDGRGTIATPLFRIIESAPFARDAEFATVSIKDAATLEKIPVPTRLENGIIGHGVDYPGPGGDDRVFFASATERDGSVPDQYRIPVDHFGTLIFAGAEEIKESERYGIGEGFPARLFMEDPQNQDAVQGAIVKLQQDYLERYRGFVVVPLRRGVFSYASENMPSNMRRGRDDPNYTANPLHN